MNPSFIVSAQNEWGLTATVDDTPCWLRECADCLSSNTCTYITAERLGDCLSLAQLLIAHPLVFLPDALKEDEEKRQAFM
jgi:hypothetical protein